MIFPDMTWLCALWALNSALNLLQHVGKKSDPTATLLQAALKL